MLHVNRSLSVSLVASASFLALMSLFLFEPSLGFLLTRLHPSQHQHQKQEQFHQRRLSTLKVLWDPKNNLDQINNGLIEFPTPSQKIELKKEASRRQARKKLPYLSISDDETRGNFSDGTLDQVWNMLQSDELVQIRGISKDDKKLTFTVATRLCLELEMRQIEDDVVLPVALLSTKGHSAIIYSPTLDLDDPKKFQLRTSVGAKNTWTERVKAPRDNRGQIIKED